MNRFYKVNVEKWLVGSAIYYDEPPLRGVVVTKVTDARTRGRRKLIVLDASDEQHRLNLNVAGVEEIGEADAVRVAAEYQPGRTRSVIPVPIGGALRDNKALFRAVLRKKKPDAEIEQLRKKTPIRIEKPALDLTRVLGARGAGRA